MENFPVYLEWEKILLSDKPEIGYLEVKNSQNSQESNFYPIEETDYGSNFPRNSQLAGPHPC